MVNIQTVRIQTDKKPGLHHHHRRVKHLKKKTNDRSVAKFTQTKKLMEKYSKISTQNDHKI